MTTEIRVTFPAESRFVSTARVTAAGLAAELEFPVDRIDELRVAVNELFVLLIEWAEDAEAARVTLSFAIVDGDLEVRGELVDAEATEALDPELDRLTEMILAGVTDGHEVGLGYGWFLKRRSVEG